MATIGYGSALNLLKKNSSMGKMKNDKKRGLNVTCSVSSSAITDPYKTLRIDPGASESEVRKAFRQLALQYHPDVCRGTNCGVQFHHINEAYDMVMSNLRGESREKNESSTKEEYNPDEPLWGMNDSEWDQWEEWMGWEGAGIRDYSSHINPYV